jgi:hypothetical protein
LPKKHNSVHRAVIKNRGSLRQFSQAVAAQPDGKQAVVATARIRLPTLKLAYGAPALGDRWIFCPTRF